jgi:mannose-6-phosphate isomerase-like protein (cupin superfamily)
MDVDVGSTVETAAVVLPVEVIDEFEWEPFGPVGAARRQILWQSGDSFCGILRVEPGHDLAPHVHHRGHHHAWILDGEAIVLGRRLGAGSYIHVPIGVEHGIAASGTRGCKLFYLYLRHGQPWNPEGLV